MPKQPKHTYCTGKKKKCPQFKCFGGCPIEMFSNYLGDRDWYIQENANTQKSINGLNNYVRESFTKKYWLHEIYPAEVREAHESGECHIHDLGFLVHIVPAGI